MKREKITVIILTKNEQNNIKDCINSVLGWADEIIVVDDDSFDKTVEIAKNLGAKVFKRKMENEGIQRNWAIKQATYDWILSLDADERVSKDLKKEIDSVLKVGSEFSAFTIPRKNFIGDYWVKWGGLYPASQIKLFKKDRLKWEEVEVHPRVFLEGLVGHLKKDIIHYTYKNWESFLNKLNKQTTLEAKKWYNYSLISPKKARYKMNFIHTLWRVFDRFIRVFIVKKGYRDGFIGFMLAYFASLYQIVSYAKYKELKRSQLKNVKD